MTHTSFPCCLACWSRPCTACSTLLTGPGPHLIRLMLAKPDQSAPLLWSTPVRLAFAFCYNDLCLSPLSSFLAATTTRLAGSAAGSHLVWLPLSRPRSSLASPALSYFSTSGLQCGVRRHKHTKAGLDISNTKQCSPQASLPIRAPMCNTYHTH